MGRAALQRRVNRDHPVGVALEWQPNAGLKAGSTAEKPEALYSAPYLSIQNLHLLSENFCSIPDIQNSMSGTESRFAPRGRALYLSSRLRKWGAFASRRSGRR